MNDNSWLYFKKKNTEATEKKCELTLWWHFSSLRHCVALIGDKCLLLFEHVDIKWLELSMSVGIHVWKHESPME